MQFRLFAKRNVLVILAFLVLFTGQAVGDQLVRSTGGTNKVAPYTSLAYADPEQAAGGLRVGKDAHFVITNVTGQDKVYRWKASVDSKVIASGSLTTTKAEASGTVVIKLKNTGRLIFSVEGLDHKLTGTVGENTTLDDRRGGK